MRCIANPDRLSGLLLMIAAICFWTGWALMPGVGITDAARILELVGAQPQMVWASSILQLTSAALLGLAIPGLTLRFEASRNTWAGWSVALLAVGACGDAADAVYHQLAYEMVQPGVNQQAVLPVMQRMQSADLLYVLPMILAFVLGCAALSVSAARLGVVAKWNPWLYAVCLAVGVAGTAAGIPARAVGLTCLGLLSLSLVWIGAALAHPIGRRILKGEHPRTVA